MNGGPTQRAVDGGESARFSGSFLGLVFSRFDGESALRPITKVTRTIRSEQVLNAFLQVVRRNLPLDLKNTHITADDIIYVLAYANIHRLSIESTCQELDEAPSGNRLREVLAAALPDRTDMQRALNRMFRQQLHPSVWKCKRDFNIVLPIIPNP